MARRPVRIANISGFFGDRQSALREQLEGGRVDVISGDYLAELTMLILAKTQSRRPDGGFARTFVTALAENLDLVVDRGVKVVVNAGGLDPDGAVRAIQDLLDEQGLTATVAAITGDDLSSRITNLQREGETFTNSQTGAELGDLAEQVVTANAYLGGWGITRALAEGADIVVTGRVADAAVVSGPAAWWHGWGRDDLDALAGAVAAGHVIECGMQATGGNYSFFDEIADLTYPAFPWADIAHDGSSVIGKHEGTGGAVNRETVLSQLLYEIGPPAYISPDVVARFDTVVVADRGDDRVSISGTRGEPPPQTLKVAASIPGGYRNVLLLGLTGEKARAKAELLSDQIWAALPWTEDEYDAVDESTLGLSATDPKNNEAAISVWRLAVASSDEGKVGRAFSSGAISTLLGSIPGMFSLLPPGPASPFARYWPTTVDRTAIVQMIELNGTRIEVPEAFDYPAATPVAAPTVELPELPSGPTQITPLGRLYGTRSGDKGGIANLGVFARSAPAYVWLRERLTTATLTEMMPDLTGLVVDRFELPNLWALNFLIHDLLGDGVSSSLRVDAQAKGLGEYLRACHFEVPVDLLS